MRLVITILAAITRAWLQSRIRRTVRYVIAWRTSYLLEQCDSDAAALCELRDKTIPKAFRSLAEQKVALMAQFERFYDRETPTKAPRPAPAPAAAAPGPWSPNLPGRVGPLFQTQRKHPQ